MRTQLRIWYGVIALSCLAAGARAQATTPWIDDFDDTSVYSPGQDPTNPSVKGWEQWDLGSGTGTAIATSPAASPPHSMFIGGNADTVQIYNEDKGTWTFKTNIYIPATGPTMLTREIVFIMMNTYSAGGPKEWSVQINFDYSGSTGNFRFITPSVPSPQEPILYDQWAELRLEIDLDASLLLDVFYGPVGNAVSLASKGFPFPATWIAASTPQIQAIDLWANDQLAGPNPNKNGGMYYDDMSLIENPAAPIVFCTAKAGLACGTPSISGAGTPSASAASGFVISAGPARTCKSGILLYNTAQIPGVPFQGGTLCVDSMGLRRAGSTNSQGTPGGANCDGLFALDMNAFAQGAWIVPDCAGNPSGIPSNNAAGFLQTLNTQIFAQWWGRDSVSTGSYVSDAISWIIGP